MDGSSVLCLLRPRAGDPVTPLCPSAMPGPSANAVGSTFKIYASRLGHRPASNCHHTLVTTAASSLLGSLLLPLPPTVSSDMWPEGSCQNLRHRAFAHAAQRSPVAPTSLAVTASLHRGPQGPVASLSSCPFISSTLPWLPPLQPHWPRSFLASRAVHILCPQLL